MKLKDGYIKLNEDLIDKNYKLERFDVIGYRQKGYKKILWTVLDGWHGRTVAALERRESMRIIYLHIKGPPKPRFETDKPYPFGY